ncbi:tyrosine-type recombinase/integrase [Bradyrhizobium sp. BR 1433]|uniref:tyrosine-type recombinase/integrase n=1 Tax=Bradyrhizobium sp. BR 1433 TaxID=3447967 RepID=UPI003EE544AB
MRKASRPFKELKHLQRIPKTLADGTLKYYYRHRKAGVMLDPDNLVESYAAAERKMRAPKSGDTFNQLIRNFETSADFDGLSQDTRDAYTGWKFKALEKKYGTLPIEVFNDHDDAERFAADALAWHQQLGKKSRRSADNLMSALCRVLSWNKEKKKIKHHPLPTFTRLYKGGQREELTWSDELQDDFLQKARATMVTAMIIARNTGQRAKDIREYPWTKYDGERVTVRQSKGKKWITIPATAELRAHLDALDRRGDTVLCTAGGKMFSKRWFNECFREDADAVEAEIDGRKLNFHDMRGTVATNLAAAGCTAFQIASVIGWSLDKCQKIIDAYIAMSGEMADAAFAKLEAHKVERARLAALRTNEAVKTLAANSNEPGGPPAPAKAVFSKLMVCHGRDSRPLERTHRAQKCKLKCKLQTGRRRFETSGD